MIRAQDISAALSDLCVAGDDVLFVHSGLRDSLRVAGDTARQKMATVLEGLRGAVPSGTLMMPTFTYSFCRGEPFDVDRSPSTVGVLTELFRRQPGVRRTAEPLYSVAIEGRLRPESEERLFGVCDRECFGSHSIFAYLEEVDAKLLFYGVDLNACTYVHRVEQIGAVPYRFMKAFPGIVRHEETETRVTANYFVRELRTGTEVHLAPLSDRLLAQGVARAVQLPDGPSLLVVDVRSLAARAAKELATNPFFLVRDGHRASVHVS